MPEANYHVVENDAIEKTLVEGSSKAKKDVNGKSKEKGKEKGKDKAKNNNKKQKNSNGKIKEKEIKTVN